MTMERFSTSWSVPSTWLIHPFKAGHLKPRRTEKLPVLRAAYQAPATDYHMVPWMGSWNRTRTILKKKKAAWKRMWILINNSLSILAHLLWYMCYNNIGFYEWERLSSGRIGTHWFVFATFLFICSFLFICNFWWWAQPHPLCPQCAEMKVANPRSLECNRIWGEAFEEETKLRGCPKDEALVQHDWCA